MDKKEDVQKSENKSDGNNEDNIFREKRQNRAGIVIGILAIVASVITGIFVMALKYTNNMPLLDTWDKFIYFMMALMLGSLIVVVISAIVFLYYELRRNDTTYYKAVDIILAMTDNSYRNFIRTVKVIIGILVFAVCIFLIRFFENKVIGTLTVLGVVIGIAVYNYRGMEKIKKVWLDIYNSEVLRKIVLPIILTTFILLHYLFQYNENNNLKLIVNFAENGMVYIDKESLDTDGVEVKVTYWYDGEFHWKKQFVENEGMRGYSGVSENTTDEQGNARWINAKLYSHFEVNMNEIENDITEKENKMIEDRKGSYVITIAVNKKKKRIVTVNRFKLDQNQRYIFAKKEVVIDYTGENFLK